MKSFLSRRTLYLFRITVGFFLTESWIFISLVCGRCVLCSGPHERELESCTRLLHPSSRASARWPRRCDDMNEPNGKYVRRGRVKNKKEGGTTEGKRTFTFVRIDFSAERPTHRPVPSGGLPSSNLEEDAANDPSESSAWIRGRTLFLPNLTFAE